MKNIAISLPVMISLSLLLSACNDDDNDSNVSLLSGVFVDSPVEGVTYTSGQTTGVTNSEGKFSYESNNSVTFKIGDIVLGSANGASIITPVELVTGATDETDATVTNIARFLQTLDDDANPDNGILIASGIKALATGKSVNFSLSISDFENDGGVQTIVAELTSVTTAGARSLVPALQAQTHLKETLLSFYVGDYTGSFSGGDQGSFSLTIHNDGSIIGNGQGSDEAFTFTGSVSSDGSAAAGNTTSGASFVLTISRDGNISGTWNNSIYGLNGTLSGSKN